MDPLLRDLQASGVGLSLNRFYAGGFLHADDIRPLATSEDSLKRQIEVVKQFADRNLLKLNVSKFEIVLFSRMVLYKSLCLTTPSKFTGRNCIWAQRWTWKG